MGNCLFGGLGEEAANEVVKVITSNGGIMEFVGPITAEFITDEFPGHGIFRNRDLFWNPLPHQEILVAGESYYLLPLNAGKLFSGQIAQIGHVRSSSVPEPSLVQVASYRMSFEGHGYGHGHGHGHGHGRMLKSSYTNSEEVFTTSRYKFKQRKARGGVWKVKLVISPGQLLEILSQEGRTQELIESVRTVAKCGNIGLSALGFSDQWSLSSSSRNTNSSKKLVSTISEI